MTDPRSTDELVAAIENSIGRPLTPADQSIVRKRIGPTLARLNAKIAELKAEMERREETRIAKRRITPEAAHALLELDRRVSDYAKSQGVRYLTLAEGDPVIYRRLLEAAAQPVPSEFAALAPEKANRDLPSTDDFDEVGRLGDPFAQAVARVSVAVAERTRRTGDEVVE